jgi:diaminopimelate epimerase
MHGAGNDFVVLDATRGPLELTRAQLRAIADRRLGVGADQILMVGPPPVSRGGVSEVDFSYRIFNADGGEVEQCGNGARAFVRFVHDKGLSPKARIRVATLAGIIEPVLETDGSVTVDMGPPAWNARSVPFDAAGLSARIHEAIELWTLELGRSSCEVALISMGNPHAVQRVESVDTAAVGRDGPALERHARFPQGVNAGFMEVLGDNEIRLRVWERGAGETLACGTGACAAVVFGILTRSLQSPVTVHTQGGDLHVAWAGPGHSVMMNGPAVSVFDGELDLAALGGLAAPMTRRKDPR